MQSQGMDNTTKAGLITDAARIIARAGGQEMRLGVDDGLADAIASVPGASDRSTVYVTSDGSYVIRTALVEIDGVAVEGSYWSRPATLAEIAIAHGETGHDAPTKPYRAAPVKS